MPCSYIAKKRAGGPYINLKALGWADRIGGLALGPKALLLLLARRSDDYGCSFYRQKILADELGCSPRSVREHVRVLEKYGLVRVIGRLENFRQTSNVYHLVCWAGRSKLPETGHPDLGRYIKEPLYKDFLAALRRQNSLHQGEKSAGHNYNNEITATFAEEEQCETCLEGLGDWVSPQEKDLLRQDYLTLLHLIAQGYSLDAHVLPVLRTKAQAQPPKKLIRSWNYFAKPVAEYAEEKNRETEAAFRAPPVCDALDASAAKEEERKGLEQALADLAQGRSKREKAR